MSIIKSNWNTKKRLQNDLSLDWSLIMIHNDEGKICVHIQPTSTGLIIVIKRANPSLAIAQVTIQAKPKMNIILCLV